MKTLHISRKIKATVLATSLLTSIGGNVNAETLVALTDANKIGIFDSSQNNTININTFNDITGTAGGELLSG